MAARLVQVIVVQALLALSAVVIAAPAMAQITVLDQAQDAVPSVAAPGVEPGGPPPPCGTQPLSIARMSWPSAEVLAEIHALILAREFDCDVRLTPGDLGATASSMGSSGQPGVAPEMWATRVADVWNAGVEAQMLRPATSTYIETQFETWFIPDYLALAQPELNGPADLRTVLPEINDGEPIRFISCPPDWACALINRNLVRAWGLGDLLEIVEPATRFEMDTLIAEAVSRSEPFVFYYWQPNAVLAQFNFTPLNMGPYDAEAAKCLARVACPEPVPSAFAGETVVVALAEWVFTDIPAIAGYFQRSSMALGEMDALLAQLNEPGATAAAVAERFVAERREVWDSWVGGSLR
jgi:glycine betaine/proline transport system substrate-binding protein